MAERERAPNGTFLPADPDRPQLPEIVSRYLAGESLQVLAAELKVHRATLYRWMLGGLGDKDYHQTVTDCLIQRVADADELLESARDQCDIARAREIARFSRMDLERRRPHLYGQRSQQAEGSGITVIIQRDQVSVQRTNAPIEGDSQQVDDN